jgi:hypothetical protein|tara:strand:+ start:913 stop:1263 length:351 start_codon:yes stop_codon:yes gene_type:complete
MNTTYEDTVNALLQLLACRADDEEEEEFNYCLALLDCLALLNTDVPEPTWMQEVIELLEVVPRPLRKRVFWALDNSPGSWSCTAGTRVEWHWKLRRTRNHTTEGTRLFAVIDGARA